MAKSKLDTPNLERIMTKLAAGVETTGRAGILPDKGALPHPSGEKQGREITRGQVAHWLEWRDGPGQPLRRAWAVARPKARIMLQEGLKAAVNGKIELREATLAAANITAEDYRKAIIVGNHIVTGTTLASVEADVVNSKEVKDE